MTEMEKLDSYLTEKGIPHEVVPFPAISLDYPPESAEVTKQIVVYNARHKRIWDAVCHCFSYGGRKGLLEVADAKAHQVRGWLTAEDVMNFLDESGDIKWKNLL